MVNELIAENKFDQARYAANLRIEALAQVCADIDAIIAGPEGEMSKEDWAQEKIKIEEEIARIQKIITSIDHTSQD